MTNITYKIESMFDGDDELLLNRQEIQYHRNIQRRFIRDHMDSFLEDPEHFRKLYRQD